ncbi:MAG: GyrI-like domain-containing protein [Actinomycetota bacterium]
MSYDIHTVEIEPQHAAVVSGTCSIEEEEVGAFLGRAFEQAFGALAREAIPVDDKPFARYEMVYGGFRIEAGLPCPPDLDLDGDVHTITLPGGTAAVTTHVGAYSDLAAAYAAIEQWFATSGHRPTGAPWETYLDGPEDPIPRTTVTWPCTLD